jgi:hypothetical protein
MTIAPVAYSSFDLRSLFSSGLYILFQPYLLYFGFFLAADRFDFFLDLISTQSLLTMRFSAIFAPSALVAIANAHTTIWNIYVNGVNQGVGNTAAGYIRSPPNNSPVKDITSNNLTCNVNNVATTKTVSAAAGDNVSLHYSIRVKDADIGSDYR